MSEATIGQILNEHSYFVEKKIYSTSLQSEIMESHPIVIHVMEKRTPSSNAICIIPNPQRAQTYYIPRNKSTLFYPHWAQDLLDKNLKFYLSPIEEDNTTALNIKEGQILISKIRYIFARFTWDADNPIGVCLHLAENHGNIKFPKKHRFRPLLANTVFVDNKSETISIQGKYDSNMYDCFVLRIPSWVCVLLLFCFLCGTRYIHPHYQQNGV